LIVFLTVAVVVAGLLLVMSRQDEGADSGSAIIKGKLVDETGVAIPNAVVYIEGMISNTTSDEQGEFSIANAPAGQQYLVVGVTPEPPEFIALTLISHETRDLGSIVLE
jgi:hypothetical protein